MWHLPEKPCLPCPDPIAEFVAGREGVIHVVLPPRQSLSATPSRQSVSAAVGHVYGTFWTDRVHQYPLYFPYVPNVLYTRCVKLQSLIQSRIRPVRRRRRDDGTVTAIVKRLGLISG